MSSILKRKSFDSADGILIADIYLNFLENKLTPYDFGIYFRYFD